MDNTHHKETANEVASKIIDMMEGETYSFIRAVAIDILARIDLECTIPPKTSDGT